MGGAGCTGAGSVSPSSLCCVITDGATCSSCTVSVAHELSGLGSTRVVRFSASGWRRIDEPDDVATGPQDAEVSRRIEPVGEQGAVGYGGSGDSRVLRATVPALSGTL